MRMGILPWGILINSAWLLGRAFLLNLRGSLLFYGCKAFSIVFLVLIGFIGAMAQPPVVNTIQPLGHYPNGNMVITGSGFSANMADLQVWFDQAKGTVVKSSATSIEVSVPPQARLHNVEVVNLATKLSGQSSYKFTPVYSGEGFDVAKLSPQSFSSPDLLFDLCSCDLDGDNKPDLVGTKRSDLSKDIMILKNQSTVGNISFTSYDKSNNASLNLNMPTEYIACGDLDGDGKRDLVASRSGLQAHSILLLRNISAGTPNFAAPIELLLDDQQFARQIAINDLNGDGKPEIVVTNSSSNILYIFENKTTGGVLTINPTPIKVTVTGAVNTASLEIQDFNADGKPDIIVAEYEKPGVFVLKNQSSSTLIGFTVAAKIPVSGSFKEVNSADFNRDGKHDLVLSDLFGNQVLVLMNQTTATAFSFGTLTLPSGVQPFGIDINDINGDGFPDIIVPDRGAVNASGSGDINVFLHNGNVASVGFTKVSLPTAKTNYIARVGDLDGDAKPDIAFTSFNATSYTIEVLRNMNCHVPKILNDVALYICPTQTIALKGINMPGVTFAWTNVANTALGATSSLSITAADTYTLTVTGEAGACVKSSAIVVTASTGSLPPNALINPMGPVCSGATLTLNSGVTVAGASYIWNGPNMATTTTATPSLSISNASRVNAGIYSLTILLGNCKSNPDAKEVQVVDLANASISSSATPPLCQGSTALLSVNSLPGYTYQWIKNGVDIAGQTASSYTASQEGTYKARITLSGCSSETAEMPITILTKPVAAFTAPTSSCVGSDVTFTNNSQLDTRAAAVYAWDFGDAGAAIVPSPMHRYVAAGTFTVSLIVSYSGLASCSGTISKPIAINAAVPPTITASATEMCDGETVTLTVNGNYTSYSWKSGQLTNAIQVSAPGLFEVTTIDPNGCTGLASATINAKLGCGVCSAPDIKAPPLFTPNMDGMNDRWIVDKVAEYQDATMNIFDVRGRRIYQITGFPLDGWDGESLSGMPVPEGTYYFVFAKPQCTPVTGSVLVIR